MAKKKETSKIIYHENKGESQVTMGKKSKWYMKKDKKDMPGGDNFDETEKKIKGLYKGSK